MGSLVFLALLLGVMYFILIRPQQRQMKEQQARIRSLEAGMIVVTNSGIHGAIAEVEDKVIWLEVAPEIELKISKGAVAEIVTDEDDDENDDEGADDLAAGEAFGRAAEPWEVANVMVFLASDLAGYMTGEIVSVSSQHP